MSLTLHKAASEMYPELQGGASKAPLNNQFIGNFDFNFSRNLVFSNYLQMIVNHGYNLQNHVTIALVLSLCQAPW